MIQKEKFKVCPNCHSSDWRYTYSETTGSYCELYHIYCTKCGYIEDIFDKIEIKKR